MNVSRTKAVELRRDLKRDLINVPLERLLSQRIFECIPYVFPNSASYLDWKLHAARLLEVEPCSIYVVGSACTLVSFSPDKRMKLFDEGPKSDIDVAVISNYHFEIAWRALRQVGTDQYKLDEAGQKALAEHKNTHVYWGMFATEKILPALPFGVGWTAASIELAKLPPTEGRDIKFRVYRDAFSLVGYHLNGLGKLREQALTPVTAPA